MRQTRSSGGSATEVAVHWSWVGGRSRSAGEAAGGGEASSVEVGVSESTTVVAAACEAN